MQCLEYDIAAQGKTPDEAKDRFEKTFLGQIALDIKENREPFTDVGRAPQKFWDMFADTKPPKLCSQVNHIYPVVKGREEK